MLTAFLIIFVKLRVVVFSKWNVEIQQSVISSSLNGNQQIKVFLLTKPSLTIR